MADNVHILDGSTLVSKGSGGAAVAPLDDQTGETPDDVVEAIAVPSVVDGLGTVNRTETNTNLANAFAAVNRDISDNAAKINALRAALVAAEVIPE